MLEPVIGFLKRKSIWGLAISGLIFLPLLYWSIDFAIHALMRHSANGLVVLFLLNVVLPCLVALSAVGCWKLVSGKDTQIDGLSLITLLGIYLTGPTYALLQSWLLQPQQLYSGNENIFKIWLTLTLMFPLSTMSFSTYDLTLPAPFLTTLGIFLFGHLFAETQFFFARIFSKSAEIKK